MQGGTNWGRWSWMRLGGGSTQFAVFQKRILNRNYNQKMPKNALLKKKAIKITFSALGAPPQPPLATVDMWAEPRIGVLTPTITNFLGAPF